MRLRARTQPFNPFEVRGIAHLISILLFWTGLTGCALELIPRSRDSSLSSNGVNLEVHLPVIFNGYSSDTVPLNFQTTQTRIDTSDYNGSVSYYFEVIATNTDAVARSIELINQAGTTKATINVPAGTAVETRFREAWTPDAGAQIYRLRLTASTAANQVITQSAKVVIRQQNATQTRLYIPLIMQYGHASFSNAEINNYKFTGTSSTYFDSSISMVYVPINLSRYSGLASNNAFRLETVLATDNAANTAYASLFNRNTNNQIVASEVSTSVTSATFVSQDFSVGATEFTDGSTISLKIRSGNNVDTAYLAKAMLSIKLTNFSKGEVYIPVQGRTNGNGIMTAYRLKLDTDVFSNPAVYYEVNGHGNGVDAKNFYLYDHGTNDSGTAGTSLIPGTSLSTANATQVVIRSAALTGITSGNRLLADQDNSAGFPECIVGFVVVGFQR